MSDTGNVFPDLRGLIVDVSGIRFLGERRITASADLPDRDGDYTLAIAITPAAPATYTLPNPLQLGTVPGSAVRRVFDPIGQASTENITIVASGGALIDGAASVVISQAFGMVELEWRGTYWHQKSTAGFDPTNPGPIGEGTPSTGKFTILKLNATPGPLALTALPGPVNGTVLLIEGPGGSSVGLGQVPLTATSQALEFTFAAEMPNNSQLTIPIFAHGGFGTIAFDDGSALASFVFDGAGNTGTNGVTYTNFQTTTAPAAGKFGAGTIAGDLGIGNNMGATKNMVGRITLFASG